MANKTQYKNLVMPISTEMYDVEVFNNNVKVIDEELHKLDEKNQSQDDLLATRQELNTHVNNKLNPHEITKFQIGLGNVDNTSDMNKPVSNEQKNAINEIYNNLIDYINARLEKVQTLVNKLDDQIKIIEVLERRISELENKYKE